MRLPCFSPALPCPRAIPPAFILWKSAELKGFSKTLAPKMNDKKVATQTLASYGNYSFMVAHREGTGEAEYHAKQADIFVVQSGEATLVVGGRTGGRQDDRARTKCAPPPSRAARRRN